MATRYGIQHADGTWWKEANLWCGHPIAARWFDSWESAQLAGLREIRESGSRWTVRMLPDVQPAVSR